jgi:hypothetical protein
MQEVVLTQGTNSLHSEILFFCNPVLKERWGKTADRVIEYNQLTEKYTDKKENKLIFLIYKEIKKGEVGKSYMTNGRPPHIGEIFAHFPID